MAKKAVLYVCKTCVFLRHAINYEFSLQDILDTILCKCSHPRVRQCTFANCTKLWNANSYSECYSIQNVTDAFNDIGKLTEHRFCEIHVQISLRTFLEICTSSLFKGTLKIHNELRTQNVFISLLITIQNSYTIVVIRY